MISSRSHKSFKSLVVALCCTSLPLLSFVPPVHAETWLNGGNSLWANINNWDSLNVPNSGSTVYFDAAGNTTVDLGGTSRDLLALFYNAGSQNYTLTGNAGDALNFTSGGSIYMTTGAGTQIINSALGLNGGAFSITNDETTNSLTLNGGISLTSGTADVLTIAGTGNTAINGGIASGAVTNLTKSGTGTLTLGGANGYTGPTTILEGTISTTAVNALGTGHLLFGDTSGFSTTVGNINIGADQTIASLEVGVNSASPNTISISSGNTLTVAGGTAERLFLVGNSVASAGNNTTNLVISGAGTLTINDAFRDIVVSQLYVDDDLSSGHATLDMSGLATFNATVEEIFIGRPSTSTGSAEGNSRSTATMRLANSNNISVLGAIGIVVGAEHDTGGLPTNELFLGTSNNIGTGRWVVGNGRALASVAFDTGLVNPTASLYGASGPGSRTIIVLGDQGNLTSVGENTGGSSDITGTMDFTGGTVNALIDSLYLGYGATRVTSSGLRGKGDGFFTFGGSGSNVDINTLEIARNYSTTTSHPNDDPALTSDSAFTMNDGTLVVNTALLIANDIDTSNTTSGTTNLQGLLTMNGGNATIGTNLTPVDTILGNHIVGGNAGSSTASLVINGGTYTSNGDIREGTLGNGTIISTLTLNGGTIDMTGGNIGAAGQAIDNLNLQAGTLANVNEINGGGGFSKTTGGTLNISGTNAISGPIAVNGGTLNLDSSNQFALGAGNVAVDDGTTLGVKAFSTSSSALTTSGSFTLGSVTGSTLDLTLAGNPSAPLLNFGSFTTGGLSTINLASTSALSPGTYTLIDYSGTIGGAGFAGLATGSMPLRTSGTLVDNVANSSVDITLATDSIRWNGGVSSVWNINTTSNWKQISAGTITTYLEPSAPGEPVRFDDNAAANFNVNVSTNVNPISVTFDNSTNAYTLSGTGGLTTPSLIKDGTNTATISTSGALNIDSIALNGSGALVINRTDSPNLAAMLSGTGTLRKEGTNSVTLSGNSAGFAGTVDIAAGSIKLGSNTAIGSGTANIGASGLLDLNGQTLTIGTGDATLAGTGNVTTTSTGTLQLASGASVSTNPIAGNVTVRVSAGSGTATMTGGSNTYTGQTQLVSGTLALSGGDNRLSTATTVSFNPDNVANATATLSLGTTNQTIAALAFPTGTGFNPPKAMALDITGSGTLTINGASDLVVGASGVTPMDNATSFEQHLDLTGLNNFVFNNSAQTVRFALTGYSATKQTRVSTVDFATNNTITAAKIALADTTSNSGAGLSTARLGQTNVWNTNLVDVGLWRSDALLQFATGLVTPTLSLRAADGSSALPIVTIGLINDNNSSRTWDSVVDLSGGSTDALISTMNIGICEPSTTNRRGHQNGTFILGAGSVTVTDLNIGLFRPTAVGMGTTGTLDSNGVFRLVNAAGTLNATTISLASVTLNAADAGTKATTGTLDIQAGTVKANTITKGVYNDTGSGLTTATARIDFSGGTLENYAGQNMAVNDVNVRMLSTTGTATVNVTGSNTVTFNAGTVVSNAGTLYKSGSGTLIYQGVNSHGGTIVNQGVVKVEGSGTFSSVGRLGANGTGVADLNGTNQTVGYLDGTGGKIVNNVAATNVTLSVGGGDAIGGNYSGTIT
ncbi:MAG: autotransporter-associated beta strand repeat-containing protein, partial [Pirellulales bacterium]|nr:autotransporter-associated beta strand repeat-containing protein [Pirellulales bacterium]